MSWKNLKGNGKPSDCGELVDIEFIKPAGQKKLRVKPDNVDWSNVKMWKDS